MRWIFLCLISFNLVYFSWQQWLVYEKKPRSTPVEALVVSDHDQLVMLTERLPEAGSSVPPPTIGEGKSSVMHQVVDHVEHKKEALCPQIGPYTVKNDATDYASKLKNVEYLVSVNVVEVSSKIDSWVLIPSEGTRKDSLQLLRELQAKKIDSYLVAEGEQKNAISLGLFQKSESALGVQERMKAAGYHSVIEEIERVKKEYWVQVNATKESADRLDELKKHTESEKNVSFSKSLCETFAQR
ncbi:hypothetical protein A9Q99_05420 [Gammaproteobacteria bacterium 45_16_T64]|nr:hypothetical protein A9Q99_05420 [Gammaproteobacteria bacterium 45_16_T64]